MAIEKEICVSLLEKFGSTRAEVEKLPQARLEEKLLKRLTKRGTPQNATEAEKKVIAGLGFDVSRVDAGETQGEAPAATGKDKKAEKADKKAPADKKDVSKGDKKADKKAAGDKTEKTDKKTKTKSGGGRGRQDGSGMSEFRKAFKEKDRWDVDDLVKRVAKAAQVDESSARLYVSVAKRPLSGGKRPNRFGFRIEEKTDEKSGVKSVRKVEGKIEA